MKASSKSFEQYSNSFLLIYSSSELKIIIENLLF